MEKECYEEEVQPYRKMDHKSIIYIYSTFHAHVGNINVIDHMR